MEGGAIEMGLGGLGGICGVKIEVLVVVLQSRVEWVGSVS